MRDILETEYLCKQHQHIALYKCPESAGAMSRIHKCLSALKRQQSCKRSLPFHVTSLELLRLQSRPTAILLHSDHVRIQIWQTMQHSLLEKKKKRSWLQEEVPLCGFWWKNWLFSCARGRLQLSCVCFWILPCSCGPRCCQIVLAWGRTDYVCFPHYHFKNRLLLLWSGE